MSSSNLSIKGEKIYVIISHNWNDSYGNISK